MSLSILAIDYALFFKVWRAQWTVSLAYNAQLRVDSKEILKKKKEKNTEEYEGTRLCDRDASSQCLGIMLMNTGRGVFTRTSSCHHGWTSI